MIVIRITWHYSHMNFNKARKLFTEVKIPQTNLLRGARGYEAVTGTGYTMALEWEFDRLSDYETFREQFNKLPENIEIFRDYPESNVQTTEIWKEFHKS
jgi:hypothetical protein